MLKNEHLYVKVRYAYDTFLTLNTIIIFITTSTTMPHDKATVGALATDSLAVTLVTS